MHRQLNSLQPGCILWAFDSVFPDNSGGGTDVSYAPEISDSQPISGGDRIHLLTLPAKYPITIGNSSSIFGLYLPTTEYPV